MAGQGRRINGPPNSESTSRNERTDLHGGNGLENRAMICRECGKSFNPYRLSQKYCSYQCREKARNKARKEARRRSEMPSAELVEKLLDEIFSTEAK